MAQLSHTATFPCLVCRAIESWQLDCGSTGCEHLCILFVLNSTLSTYLALPIQFYPRRHFRPILNSVWLRSPIWPQNQFFVSATCYLLLDWIWDNKDMSLYASTTFKSSAIWRHCCLNILVIPGCGGGGGYSSGYSYIIKEFLPHKIYLLLSDSLKCISLQCRMQFTKTISAHPNSK